MKHRYRHPDGTTITVTGPQADKAAALIKAAPGLLSAAQRALAELQDWRENIEGELDEEVALQSPADIHECLTQIIAMLSEHEARASDRSGKTE